ncbi:MCE family protein [Mycolicibacterium septicum]|uniref:MCE family protein n=1 Tax=Mycolicibacterium septicum TaxID=98668 RepID=UPI00235F32D3|nr:MCE family protein [Mycolicibacterium septicum]
MEPRPGEARLHTAWWTLILLVVIAVFMFVTGGFFSGFHHKYVSVTLRADRAGLVMDPEARVKLRGVEVGRVRDISGGNGSAELYLDLYPDQVSFIPANVSAQIQATTAFGAKFVDLIYPEEPAPQRISAGDVLTSTNTSDEVNTVFENVVNLLQMVDPAKLNAVLSAVADGVRGQGERMGQATTALNEVLTALNQRSELIRADWRSFGNFNATYAAAAEDILAILNSASTTGATVARQSNELDRLLMNTVGLADAGTSLLAASKDSIVNAVNMLGPTSDLLYKYNPVYTCFLQGSQWFVENGGFDAWGGMNGKSIQLDVGLLLGNDPYSYPDNLPIVAAKGGPGGKPGCGSLPDASKNFPVRQLVTNTGFGTGLDIRPNPGIGHPCWADYFPVTRAVPQQPSIRQCLPGPAPGPIPYPGAPPYGAALYGPGGVPLWPGVPPAPATPEGAPPPTDPVVPTP